MFSFPNPVNETSARLVAAGVVVLGVLTIALDQRWLIVVLAYGFVARVVAGPTFSPLAQLVTRVVTPRLRVPAKYVPGPPKRFAQGIGATFSVAAVVAQFGFGETALAYVFVCFIVVAATLESVFAYCVGCRVFALLMRTGVIPERVCEECNDIWNAANKAASRDPRPTAASDAARDPGARARSPHRRQQGGPERAPERSRSEGWC